MVFGKRMTAFSCGLGSFVTGLSGFSFVFNKLYTVGLRSLCKHQPKLRLPQEEWNYSLADSWKCKVLEMGQLSSRKGP